MPQGKNLKGRNLSRCHVRGADPAALTLDDVDLSEGSFTASNDGVSFRHAILKRTRFYGSCSHANFSEALLCCSDFTGSTYKESLFAKSDLKDALFRQANLSGSSFVSADLRGVCLDYSDIANANLRGVTVNTRTSIREAAVSGVKIQRITLEFLSDSYSGLTRGDRMTMIIEDDVATLREEFDGFKQWMHLVSIAVFFMPYIWHVSDRMIDARLDACKVEKCAPLFNVLYDYAWLQQPCWSRAILVFYLVYNVSRVCLLYKTKSLALMQQARGLPPLFLFEKSRWWYCLYCFAHYGFWFHIVFIFFNSASMMNVMVPGDSNGSVNESGYRALMKH